MKEIAPGRCDLTDTQRASPMDIKANRSGRKYTVAELVLRVVWALAYPAFRFSPRICFGFRAFLLRCFGAKIGKQVNIYPTASIQYPWNLWIDDQAAIGEFARIYNLGQLRVGKRATISQHAHLCGGSHDYQSTNMQLIKSPIVIEDDAWVCADAFVGPGVTIGAGAVVGARAVVMKDVEPWTVVAGNPAVKVKDRRMAESQGHTTESNQTEAG